MRASRDTRFAVTTIILSLFLFILVGCGGAEEPQSSTIVIVNPLGVLLQDFTQGFVDGMAEAGYVDGEKVNYVYAAEPESLAPPAIEGVIRAALEGVDPAMVVCLSTTACTTAKTVLADTDTPLLFMGVTDPIGTGLVTDFAETEQVTGIASGARNAANEGRAFEWLVEVAPDIDKVFIPHNPEDVATNVKLAVVQDVAASMGIELVIHEASTEEELDGVIEAIPADADAVITYSERIFTVPFMTALTAYCIENNLPHLSFSTQYGQMMSYAPETYAIGQQAAVLGARVLQGTAVSDLPVEVPEFNLYINLPTVDAMGFEISDQILRQAVVIRDEEAD